jgi:hypothetical protein
MDEKRKNADWLAVATLMLAVFVLPLAVYFGGYFTLGGVGTVSTQYETKMCRFYSAQWQAALFRPAAQVESFFAGHEIKTGYIPNAP